MNNPKRTNGSSAPVSPANAMKTIEIEISYPAQDGRPPDTDWIPDHAVTETLAEIKAAGLVGKVVREVPWQEQLARMENNPE